jgi:heat shock protein HslJ
MEPTPPPTFEDMKRATFKGLDRGTMEVTLDNGAWVGKPSRKDSTIRQHVTLIEDFLVTGDLDSNGNVEAVVLLNETFGGEESFTYMAAVAMENGKPVNKGTELLGDRVQIREISVKNGSLFVSLVETAPFDKLCCPGQLVIKEWKLRPRGFVLHELKSPGRLSLALLAGSEWMLKRWNTDDPVVAGTNITMTYKDGQLAGTSGCNRFFAQVAEGPLPGDITPGPPGSTRMACADSVMVIENRFLSDLQSASKFGFLNGRLAITVGADSSRVLLFERPDVPRP